MNALSRILNIFKQVKQKKTKNTKKKIRNWGPVTVQFAGRSICKILTLLATIQCFYCKSS